MLLEGPDGSSRDRENVQLLFFFVIMTQLGDVLQYAFGRLWGRHVIAPAISPNRTWEGLAGGVGMASMLGAALWWATPFNPWQAALMAMVITLSGFAGGMTMSAIKRDRGVQDYGTLVEGHGGVLDRIDSLCFAAPVFFHVTKTLAAVEIEWLRLATT
jgi:phosphatidate cytidylyltransferase